MSKLLELDDKNEGFKNMALALGARKKAANGNKSIEEQKPIGKTVENVSPSTTGGESESVKDLKSHDAVHDKEEKLVMVLTEPTIETEKEKEKGNEKETEKKKDKNDEKEKGKEKVKEKKKDKNDEKENKKEKGKGKEKEKEKKNDKNDEKGNKKEKKKNKNVDTKSSSSSSSESDEDIDENKSKSSTISWQQYLQLPTSKPWIWLGVIGMSLLVLVGGAAKMMNKPRDKEDHETTKKRMNSGSTDDKLHVCPSCSHNHKQTLG